VILGVTGNFAAGKDAVAEILQKMNFYHVSLSDMIRDELRSRKKEITRDNLIEMGNEMRREHGASILAARALEKVKDGENHVFTSIRNPEEVKLLQQREDFALINVIAPDNVRLARIKARAREKDPMTIEELRAKEARENTSDPASQQLNKVASMANIVLKNDGTKEQLEAKVTRIVKDWLYKLQESRPDWDHYFMNIAEQVKLRSSCLSAKKGTLIVLDKQIISTGYCGSPKGIKHCTAGGCPRCTSRHLGKIKSGVYSEPCICAHSEENAIVQAAYNGIATKGATMYTTFSPCVTCCKMIINAGITRVVGKVKYPDDVGLNMLKEAGVKFEIISQ
jgi:dCMP deaminase